MGENRENLDTHGDENKIRENVRMQFSQIFAGERYQISSTLSTSLRKLPPFHPFSPSRPFYRRFLITFLSSCCFFPLLEEGLLRNSLAYRTNTTATP
jgi:hypothetical protein